MTTHMHAEIGEIPEAAARLLAPDAQEQLRAIATTWRAQDVGAFVTIARGSSDHAATCLKYAIEIASGIPVASVGPSVVTQFGATMRGASTRVIAISQSGSSQDLAASARGFAKQGADLLVLTNKTDSPLAQEAREVFAIRAGPELAVAATKSYVNSVLSGLWLVAYWRGDSVLQSALRALPDRLAAQLNRPNAALSDLLASAPRGFVVARGPGLGIAQEIALKMLEVCGVHASAYSAAEVWHGPAAVIGPDMPVLVLEPADTAAARARDIGAPVVSLPTAPDAHPLLGGLEQLVVAYMSLEAAARARGRNPDAPPHLKKETITL